MAADKAKFTAIAPTFVVEDVVKTAEYYRDFLGFEILGYFADPPVYAMVGRDAAEVHFGKPDDDEVYVSNTKKRKVSGDLYIWVSDIQVLFDELTASGADIEEGPVKRIYQSTEVVVRDLNGLRIIFGN